MQHFYGYLILLLRFSPTRYRVWLYRSLWWWLETCRYCKCLVKFYSDSDTLINSVSRNLKYSIMQLLENLPDNIGLIMRSGIMSCWLCACVNVISVFSSCLIGCTVTFHVISTFRWLNDVTVVCNWAWRDIKSSIKTVVNSMFLTQI